MDGFDVVDPRYRPLYERAIAVLGADRRVVSAGVSGSIARGTADAWSDLDMEVVAASDDYESFLTDWPSWLAAITPTVFARTPIAPFIINTCTSDGLVFDLAVYRGRPSAAPSQDRYRVGLLSTQPIETLADALEYAVAEQLRGLVGPFITLVQREEHMRHLTGVPHILGLLTTVFLAENGGAPPGKLWNQSFSVEQRTAVAELPPLHATRDGVVNFGLELARLLVSRARPLYPRYGLVWPADFAAVAASRLDDCLAIDVHHWLY